MASRQILRAANPDKLDRQARSSPPHRLLNSAMFLASPGGDDGHVHPGVADHGYGHRRQRQNVDSRAEPARLGAISAASSISRTSGRREAARWATRPTRSSPSIRPRSSTDGEGGRAKRSMGAITNATRYALRRRGRHLPRGLHHLAQAGRSHPPAGRPGRHPRSAQHGHRHARSSSSAKYGQTRLLTANNPNAAKVRVTRALQASQPHPRLERRHRAACSADSPRATTWARTTVLDQVRPCGLRPGSATRSRARTATTPASAGATRARATRTTSSDKLPFKHVDEDQHLGDERVRGLVQQRRRALARPSPTCRRATAGARCTGPRAPRRTSASTAARSACQGRCSAAARRWSPRSTSTPPTSCPPGWQPPVEGHRPVHALRARPVRRTRAAARPARTARPPATSTTSTSPPPGWRSTRRRTQVTNANHSDYEARLQRASRC